MDAIFSGLKGIERVVCGHAGGWKEDPAYEEVCSDTTGHAEVLLNEFDSSVISYRELLEIFLALHDPTTTNRQGHDVGSQYRSIIPATSEEHLKTARDVIRQLEEMGALQRQDRDGGEEA
jgi:peptide-methionine (S)-S-oxide reductase